MCSSMPDAVLMKVRPHGSHHFQSLVFLRNIPSADLKSQALVMDDSDFPALNCTQHHVARLYSMWHVSHHSCNKAGYIDTLTKETPARWPHSVQCFPEFDRAFNNWWQPSLRVLMLTVPAPCYCVVWWILVNL